MNRISLLTALPAALILAGCNPDPAAAPPHDAATAPAPAPASAPWDYATPQADPAETAPADASANTIPVPYRATWAIEAADCTSEPGLTRITIEPDGVRFYEARSTVLASSVSADGRLNLDVEHVAEGTTETQRHIMVLAGDGQSLSYTRGDNAFAYTRCAD